MTYEIKLYDSPDSFKNRKWYDEFSGYDSMTEAKNAALKLAQPTDIIKVQSMDREEIEIMDFNGNQIEI